MRFAAIALLLAARIARAEDVVEPAVDDVDPQVTADKVEVLEERVKELHEQVKSLRPLKRFISVFVDVGFFAAGGDGSGVRSDTGHRYIHDYDGVPAEWVLMGDPLSTMINSNGEPADLGASRSITDDTIDSEGRPTFIVNTVGLAIGRAVTDQIAIAGLVEFLPRTGPDAVVVEHAHVNYRPSQEINLVLSAGKVDSVLGIDYRSQDAPDRLTITPPLLCRYTCGRPYGIRAHLERKELDLSALVANGDSFQERFEPDPRLASAKAPTVSGHVQYLFPIFDGIKVGASFAVGPQDGQDALHVHQWHYGFDLRVRETHKFSLQAEFVQGRQQGSSTGQAEALDTMPDATVVAPHCSIAQCLRYKSAYGLASYRVQPKITPYVRVDWRSARHQRGVDFLYVSRVLRTTVGAQFAMTSRILGKIEYSMNRELVGPQFPNDVITTSIVVSTE